MCCLHILYDNWRSEVNTNEIKIKKKLLMLMHVRAVVWTDAIQFILMIAAIVAVIILGLINLQYPMEMFSIPDNGGRLILFE